MSLWWIGIAVLLAQDTVPTQLPPSPAPEVAARTWVFPALSFGVNRWSTVKVTNQAETAKTVRVEIFGPDGAKMAASATLRLIPKEGTEIRIAPESKAARELCWARVSEMFDGSAAGVNVQASVEILRGNQIEVYPRDPVDVRKLGMWGIASVDLKDKNLYILNVDPEPMVIAFCADNSATVRTCQDRRRGVSRYSLAPRQALIVNPNTGSSRFFFVEVPRGKDMAMISLAAGAGAIKVFSSDSQIRFGETDR